MSSLMRALGAATGAIAMGLECLILGGMDLTQRVLSRKYIWGLIILAAISVLTVVGTVIVGFATESQGCFLFGAIAFVFWATLFFVAALPALLFAGSVKAVVGLFFGEKPPMAAAIGEKKK